MRRADVIEPAAHLPSDEGRRGAAARRSPLRLVEIGVLLGGSALLIALVRASGTATLGANLRLVGWGILLVIAQELFAVVANTLGWWAAFPRPRPALPFRRLIAARLAGDAFNYVTPTASIGGELVRARVLAGQASRIDIAASIAVAKLSQIVGQVAFIAVGVAWALVTLPLPPALRVALGIVTAALIVAASVLVVAQRRGMFGVLARIVGAFDRGGRFVDLGARMQRLDVEIARVHQSHASYVASCAWFFVGWALGALEIYLIMWLLGLPAGVTLAVTIEALSQIIDAVLFFVPAKLGTQEGGKILIFTALGLDASKGLSLGVVRRVRELVFAAVGLLILWRRQLGAIDAGPSPAATRVPLSTD